jgi:phenylacetyl-CoA:acceptor oxidoreductase subunit 2
MSEAKVIDRVVPRQQKEWDIKGALNFVFGGAGGGLLVASPFAAALGADPRPFIALGLVLVGAGLFSVWLKIGRPWRAVAFQLMCRYSSSGW